MFCNNCGNQVEEGTVFCQNCGSPVGQEGTPQPEWEAPVENAGKSSGKIKIIIGAAVVVVAAVVLILVLGGKKYEKTLNAYLDAAIKAKGKEFVNLALPEEVQKELFKEMDISKKEFYDRMDEVLENKKEYNKENGIKISYEIKKAESLKKLDKLEDEVEAMIGGDDLKDFRDSMDDMYGDYDLDEDKIKNAYVVEVKVTQKSDEGKTSDKSYFIVYKYDGKWYVWSEYLNFH